MTNERKRSRRKKMLVLAGLVCLVVGLSGCETVGYYRQAIVGQYQIFSRREPVRKLIARAQTPAALKERLQLVLALRAFADQQLALPVDGHYLKYADLKRKHVVWNVYAAPELSLEQKTWWYPVVGRLKYRGYFSEEAATNYAARLQRQYWDVYVSGVDAYSTLGWFKESLLNTFINDPEAELAETLFHELAHQRLFISGDTDFNEAFAVVVGQEGARRWLKSSGKTNELAEYALLLRREDEFVQLVQRTRARLKALYESPQADEAKRAQKQQILQAMRDEYQVLRAKWNGHKGYDRWFARPLNNAQLNTVATYFDLVPAFERLLAAHNHNLKSFYKEVEQLRKLSKDERRQRLASRSS